MSSRFSLADVLALPADERIQIIEDIWDSIAAAPESMTLTDKQRAELDSRLQAYHENPSAGSPWADVKQRIRERLK